MDDGFPTVNVLAVLVSWICGAGNAYVDIGDAHADSFRVWMGGWSNTRESDR